MSSNTGTQIFPIIYGEICEYNYMLFPSLEEATTIHESVYKYTYIHAYVHIHTYTV